jgi:hypothetical protein
MDRQETGYKLSKFLLAVTAGGVGASLSNPSIGGMISGGVVEAFPAIFASPMDKRRDRSIGDLYSWVDELHNRLMALEQGGKDFEVEDLINNEAFISILIQATQVAIKTHQQEKLEALRNLVVNVALDIDIDEDIRQWCVSQIDSFTTTHLRLLIFLDNPKEFMRLRYPNLNATNPSPGAPEEIFTGLGDSLEFYNQVYQDLDSLGLLKVPNLNPTVNELLIEANREKDRQYYGKQVESGQTTSAEADKYQHRRSKQLISADSQNRVNLNNLVKQLIANPTQNLSTNLGHTLVLLISS